MFALDLQRFHGSSPEYRHAAVFWKMPSANAARGVNHVLANCRELTTCAARGENYDNG